MTLVRPAQALLDLVEADRSQKCGAILAEAQARRAELLRLAHADARARMRTAFREERLRRNARVDAARANLQTRRRVADQQRAAALLSAGWTKLPGALVRRWQTPDLRQRWVDAVVVSARNSLSAGAWRIVHAVDWPVEERDALAAGLAAAGLACAFDADGRIRAGLRISANGNVIDGTLDGLLSDRAEIGSRLLRLLEEETTT